MDRLTVYIEGEAREDHSRDTAKWKNGSRACMTRLAAYEDTGLMPDEIEALKQREQFLTEAYDRNAKVHEALTRDYLAEKRDIKRMLQDTDPDGFCVYCQHLYREACDGCEDAEWRGPQEGANE